MRKQYDLYEGASFRYWVVLYHDGVKVDAVKKWQGDELSAYLDKLESEGYTRGYTKDDVEEAYKKYIHIYNNRIEQED